MGKTQSVRLQKKLHLIKYQNSANWYAVYHELIDGKYDHRKSTRTSDLREATKRAEEFWFDWKLAARGEKPISESPTASNTTTQFDRIVDDWLDELKQEAGDDAQRLRNYRDKKRLCFAQNGFTAFFGKDAIKTINTDRIRAYLRFQVENSRQGKLSTRTQRGTLIVLGLILKYAASKGLIAFIPTMPPIRIKRVARTWLTHKEYERVLLKARGLKYDAMKVGDAKAVRTWAEAVDFIEFMVGSFLRSSEWADLRHRHIEVVSEKDKRHLRIAVIKGKTKPRYTISMPWAVNAYNRIVTRVGNDPDAFVFLPEYPNRYTASKHMRSRFKALLEATGLKIDALGQSRVIHCLRHSAIMFRLIEGVDIHLLATNAGTSVEQIELHYASQFTADMKLDELHKSRAAF